MNCKKCNNKIEENLNYKIYNTKTLKSEYLCPCDPHLKFTEGTSIKEPLAVFDGDSIPYIIGHVHREASVKSRKHVKDVCTHVDEFVIKIINKIGARIYMGFLGGRKNFRYDLAKHKPYKGNRKNQINVGYQKWKHVVIDRLVNKWGFKVLEEPIEADDAVSIVAKQLEDHLLYETVIVGVDKDLLQIPSKHFNFNTWELKDVDALGFVEEIKEKKYNSLTGKSKTTTKYKGVGFKWLMFQMITGDTTDNISGLKGKGGAYAYKVLKDKTSIYGCFRAVALAYEKQLDWYYGKIIFREMLSLLRMLTEHTEFTLPEFRSYQSK